MIQLIYNDGYYVYAIHKNTCLSLRPHGHGLLLAAILPDNDTDVTMGNTGIATSNYVNVPVRSYTNENSCLPIILITNHVLFSEW